MEDRLISRETNKGVQALLVLLALFSILNYLVHGYYGGLKYKGGDFLNYYMNASLLKADVNIHDDDIREQAIAQIRDRNPGILEKKHHQPDYPVFWYLMIVPLTYFSWDMAFYIWLSINQILLALIICLLYKYFSVKLFSVEGIGTLFIILNFYPLWYNMMEGQCNVLLFLLIIGGLWSFKKDKVWLAGLLFGIATGIKLVPAFLIFFFLLRGRWKLVIWSGVGFIATILISVIGAGSDIVISYFTTQLPKYGGVPRPEPFNQSINGFVSRLFTCSDASNGWFNKPALANNISTALSLIVVGLTIFFTRKKSLPFSDKWNLDFGIFLTASMLVSSWTMEHHFVSLYFVWLLMFTGFTRKDNIPIRVMMILSALFVLLAVDIPYQSANFNSGMFILVKSFKFYLILLLWTTLIWQTAAGGWDREQPST